MIFNKTTMKWLVLVSINAVFSFFLALDVVQSTQGLIGILLAIFTFIFLYIQFESFLERKTDEKWRKALIGAVVVSALLQFFVVIHLITGAIAVDFINRIFSIPMRHSLEDLNTFFVYSITITDGILLSILVGGITLIIRLLMALWENYRTSV